MDEQSKSRWVEVFPEVYAEDSLRNRGVVDFSVLARFVTKEGEILYPSDQFICTENGSLIPDTNATELWEVYFAPALEKNIIPDTMACDVLLGARRNSYLKRMREAVTEEQRQKIIGDIERFLWVNSN